MFTIHRDAQVRLCVFQAVLYSCFLLVGFTTASNAQVANSVPTSSSGNGTLGASSQRVEFDVSAFEGISPSIPYWDRGFLISREVETLRPDTPNIRLYDGSGRKVKEISVWFPEAQRVVVSSAALTADSRVVATGEANKPDGTRVFYVLSTNFNGNVRQVVQTGNYHPRHACAAPNGTVWTLGGMQWDFATQGPTGGNVLRNIDLQKGETATYIPRSTFPPADFDSGGTWMRCSGQGVDIYVSAGSYIRIAYGEEQPHIYRAAVPEGSFLSGFAVLESGQVFGFLASTQDSSKSINGLYQLVLDDSAKTGRWVRVVTDAASPVHTDGIIRLWGADSDNLVVSVADDPVGRQAFHWRKFSSSSTSAAANH